MGIRRSVLLGTLAAAFLPAQNPVGAHNQIFSVPPGWSRSDQQGNVTLRPDSAPQNLVLLFLSGRPLPATFRDAFDQDVKALNGPLRLAQASEVQSRRSADGVEMLTLTVELRNAGGVPSYRHYLAANPPGRIEMLIYTASSQELFQRYWPDVQRLVSTRTFASVGGSPAGPPSGATASAPTATDPPPSTPGRFEAIYSGHKWSVQTILGAVQRTLATDTYTFFADGTVYHALPINGLVGFNMARENQAGPEWCGTYEVAGNQVNMVFNRGTYRRTGTMVDGNMRIDGLDYVLRSDPSKTASQMLDGVYYRADARPGEELARRWIRFTRDGQFTDQGIVESVATSEIINGNPRMERPRGAGAYRLSRYTLILRYSDGYVRQLPITADASEMSKPVPKQVSVNTYMIVAR